MKLKAQKKKKKQELFSILGAIALGIPAAMFGGPVLAFLGKLAVIGGISYGILYAYSFSWELKIINEDELNKIAKKCVFYNKRKHYNPFSNNCQIFVNDILKEIDAPFDPKGELRKVIDKYRKMDIHHFLFREENSNQEENLMNM